MAKTKDLAKTKVVACCGSLLAEPLGEADATDLARAFGAPRRDRLRRHRPQLDV